MSWGLTFALVFSSIIGLSLGLLGSGGSIVTLPKLVYIIAGLPVPTAVGMSLVVVGCYIYRRGNFR